MLKKIDLNGEWSLKGTDGVRYPAKVPGCNYTDLIAAGVIEDPFDKMNEKKSFWVSEKDWIYEREFTLESTDFDFIDLVAEQLDTIAEVYINNELCVASENAFREVRVGVKQSLQKGNNHIKIVFYSPVQYIAKKQKADAMPLNMNCLPGVPHIRKPQCHFGWDWGPALPASGITGNIYLEAGNAARIKFVDICQTHESGKVTLSLRAELRNEKGTKLKEEYQVITPDGKTLTAVDGIVVIEDPRLWWCIDMGEQPLYKVICKLYDQDELVDECEKKVGLRTIQLNTEKDEYGKNFQFVLNGVPIFAKGANWIPPDSFIDRFQEKELEYYISAMKRAHMNMVRVWGGGYFPKDDFYNRCDEEGILVWQDFMFACAPYPFYDESFLNEVKQETEENIKRLKHHAALALWCGNNEIEAMSAAWMNRKKLKKWTKIFFYEILAEIVKKTDPATPFISGSPTSYEYGKFTGNQNIGDTHLWAVWHGLQPLTAYRKNFTRFCSEYGLESLAPMDTIRSFAAPEELSLRSEVFSAHQKCSSGNSKMLYYMSTRFRVPDCFEHIVYLSQIIQSECIKDATEHWRRNRGRCNGALYWQLNDCWPVTSWSSMDYYGRYKALQYQAQHIFAPVSLSCIMQDKKAETYVINDKNEGCVYNLELTVKDFKGAIYKKTKQELYIEPLSVIKVDCYVPPKKAFKNGYLKAKLTNKDGETVSERTLLFTSEKKAALPNAKLEVSAEKTEGGYTVSVKSDSYARYVCLQASGAIHPFSDNFFDLEAGESKKVFIPDEEKREFSAFSVCDAKFSGSAFKDLKMRLKVALKPFNVAQWFYYKYFM